MMAGDACIHNITNTCEECREFRGAFTFWLEDQKDFGDLSPREISLAVRAWQAGKNMTAKQVREIVNSYEDQHKHLRGYYSAN
jgi:hypothetical protein